MDFCLENYHSLSADLKVKQRGASCQSVEVAGLCAQRIDALHAKTRIHAIVAIVSTAPFVCVTALCGLPSSPSSYG